MCNQLQIQPNIVFLTFNTLQYYPHSVMLAVLHSYACGAQLRCSLAHRTILHSFAVCTFYYADTGQVHACASRVNVSVQSTKNILNTFEILSKAIVKFTQP